MNLIETIKKDCLLWEKEKNADMLFSNYLYLNECECSAQNGFYQLVLNGAELWFGTLQEINAIIKTMILQITEKDYYLL